MNQWSSSELHEIGKQALAAASIHADFIRQLRDPAKRDVLLSRVRTIGELIAQHATDGEAWIAAIKAVRLLGFGVSTAPIELLVESISPSIAADILEAIAASIQDIPSRNAYAWVGESEREGEACHETAFGDREGLGSALLWTAYSFFFRNLVSTRMGSVEEQRVVDALKLVISAACRVWSVEKCAATRQSNSCGAY